MANNAYFRNLAAQVVTIAVTSAQSTAFGPQTTYVRLATPAVGVWYKVGSNPTASITDSAYLPPNWTEIVAVAPGEKVACIQPTTPAGTFNITELTS